MPSVGSHRPPWPLSPPSCSPRWRCHPQRRLKPPVNRCGEVHRWCCRRFSPLRPPTSYLPPSHRGRLPQIMPQLAKSAAAAARRRPPAATGDQLGTKTVRRRIGCLRIRGALDGARNREFSLVFIHRLIGPLDPGTALAPSPRTVMPSGPSERDLPIDQNGWQPWELRAL
jgi:hypothetical protein